MEVLPIFSEASTSDVWNYDHQDVRPKRSIRKLWSVVQDQMSTYQLQQMTGDGLVLAMVRTRDQTLETNQREELAQEVLQLVLVFLLHIASLFLQFGLTYHLYITTVDGLAAPFDEGVGAYMQVIQQAVEQDPPHALSKDNDVQKDALDLCVKQHAMGYVHLMVLSLWAARMVAEISELLNRLTILSLIADPTNEPLARAFLQEREDGRMLIAYMGRRMKVAVITLCILPKLGCTIFLMWTGGKLFMLTYTMGSLIIPLLTLTYILQIPSILFTGFSSFKFKEKLDMTQYEYNVALCYSSQHCQMWGLTVIKTLATFFYVFMIYGVVFRDVTSYRNLCSRYLAIFPQGSCSFRCHLGITSPK